MSEKKGWISFGNELAIYGNGVGLKTEDLVAFAEVASERVSILKGIAVGINHFDEVLEASGLTDSSDLDYSGDIIIPENLRRVNQEILQLLPQDKPIFVRSSANDERGGSGIYDSDIFFPSGDSEQDLTNLEWAEKIVYSSYFFDQAKHHREKHGTEDGGISILMQPVIGDRYKKYFMPALSGVLTTINGNPVLRLVMGLGIKAVEMDQAIVLKGDKVNAKKAIDNLSYLKEMYAVDMEKGELAIIPVEAEFIDICSSQVGKLETLLKEWERGFENGKPFYLEFAITPSESKPVIVQASPDDLKEVEYELGKPQGVVACEGVDVVNMGSRQGRGILWVGRKGFSKQELTLVEQFNENNSDYLLVIVDKLFSGLIGPSPIQMQHFSNAAGVVEIQHIRKELDIPGLIQFTIDHTGGRGGAHFTEICKREDILFLGVIANSPNDELAAILGRATDDIGTTIGFWDVDFSISNGKTNGRVEVLGEVVRSEYSRGEIDRWANEFWYLAKALGDGRVGTLSDTFYGACHVLVEMADAPLVDFDPFDVSRLDLKGEKRNEVISTLEIVIANINLTDSHTGYEMGFVEEFRLKNYLEQLFKTIGG